MPPIRILTLAVGILAATTFAQDKAAPGDFVIEAPTYICLGFHWQGTGDANKNASVTVSYRKRGGDAWKAAMPLVRLNDNDTLFAGSLFDLEQDTEYECRFVMTDPDGIDGEAEKTVTVRTRKPMMIPDGLEVRHAYMAEHQGERRKPAHTGLLHAIWGGHLYQRGSTDWVKGGEMIQLHAGYYKGKKFDKRDWRGHLAMDCSGWHGYPLSQVHGSDKPLVIRPAGDGPVVIDGSGMPELFDLAGAQNVIIEGLILQNAGIAFQFAEARTERPSRNITIRNCVIRDVAHVAYGDHPDNENITITDCLLIGRQEAVIGSWGSTFSRQAITIAGRGHVYSYNRVIDFFDYVNLGAGNISVDIYNNDVQRAGDNAMCLNSLSMNVRALRNSVFNGGDPQFDNRNRIGPTYWIRNVLYNMRSDRGFKNDGGIGGLIALHNTMTAYPLNFHTYTYGHIANNLFLGGKGKKGPAKAVRAVPEQRVKLHHNGYFLENAQFSFGDKSFRKPAEFHEASGLAEGAVGVTFDDFVNAPNPHGFERQPPHTIRIVDPATVDLRLKSESGAIDAAALIPNVNDDFTGHGPDLGAYEHGKPLPHYGPRQELPGEWYMTETTTNADAVPAAPGKAVIRVASGMPWPYKDPAGNIWLGDQEYRWPRQYGYVGNPNAWFKQSRKGKVQNTELQNLYTYERAELDAYHFALPAGKYVVRLHWVERWGDGRFFDVTINNKRVLENFSIYQAGGGDHKPIYKDFPVDVNGSMLTIDFKQRAGGSPMVNGIEIFNPE